MLLLVQAVNDLHTEGILGTSDSLGEAPHNTISTCEEGPCMGKNWLSNCNMYNNLHMMYKQNFINLNAQIMRDYYIIHTPYL
jgi:hypothetical protein